MLQPELLRLDDLLSPQLDWLFQQPQRLGKPSGWWGHVPFAFWLVAAARPRTLVELGSHHGVSYAAFCEAVSLARLDCRCFAVDNWQGDAHAGFFDEAVYNDLLDFNRTRYGAFSELLRADFNEALAHFADGSIDVLHIDGFHTYEAVCRDYLQWRPKLSPRAIVLFHDTNVRRDDFGVHRLFAELSRDYPHFEFLHGNGLGLIAHGSQAPEVIRHLCTANSDQTASLRERFAHLGARWQGHAREQEMARSFALQVEALESERIGAGEQRAAAEAKTQQLQLALADTQDQLNQARQESERTQCLAETVSQLSEQLQAETVQYRRLQEERQRLETLLAETETRLGQSRQELNTGLANAELQTRRLAQDLLVKLPLLARPSPLRRLRLLLRRGHAQRNPIADVVRRSSLFDAHWYLRTYIDVAESGIEPAFHYVAHGGIEGRDPGPWFSTRDYLRLNPDVAQAGVNALYHYELHGRHENRNLPLPSTFAAATPEQHENTDIKAVFRRDSMERLQAFLGGSEPLLLPTSQEPLLSIILVLHNQAELTFRCLQSLITAIDVPCEVLLVDNASSDLTRELLKRVHGSRVLLQNENLHFLRAANLGAAQARGSHLLFLNNDTLIKAGSLSAAIRVFAERNEVGAVGGKLILLDGTLQEAGSIVWNDGSCQGYGRGRDPQEAEFQFRREVDYCSGAFLMVPRPLFEQLGGFDSAFAPAYYEETDLCMRLRQGGHAVVYEPAVEVVHVEFGSATHSQAATQLMQAHHGIFRERHAVALQQHQPHGNSALEARMRPGAGARVLLIDDQIPIPSWGSGYPRAHELLMTLHRLGAFVTLYPVAAAGIDFAEAYAVLPRETEIAEAQGAAGLPGFLRSRRDYYDALIISRPHNMQLLFDALEHEPDLLGRTRLIYDAEAIFAQRNQLKANLLGHSCSITDMADELRLARPAQTILAVNRTESEHFTRAGHPDVRVLSHGIELQPTPGKHAERQDLLFVGRLEENDSPNADSIRWFIGEVMPRLDRLLGNNYCLNIVGACSTKLRRDLESRRVRFHGRVQDITDFYADARLFIAPTRFAAGIPLKIYEAAAHGLPVVASQLLADQLAWKDDGELLTADTAEGFAAACARLYNDANLWARLREQALLGTDQDCSKRNFTEQIRQLLDELPPRDYAAKINQAWGQRNTSRGMNWMEHPLVLARLNRKVSGDPKQECCQYLRQLLLEQGWQFPVKRAASLGCGFGSLERALAHGGFAERIDGYDLAASAIAEARRLAAQESLPGLHYQVANMEQLRLPQAQYDLIFAFSSAHHVDDLDGLFGQVRQALRPGGVFMLHEYVGPDRFQWTDTQLEQINAFIESLPAGYNCLPDGRVRGQVRRPSVEEVIACDPSEAIRSSEIIASLNRQFDRVLNYELGGALLHTGLSDIAQNFSPEQPADIELLERFFALEDRLMAEGSIASDFCVLIAFRD
ncbi:Glycosyltransferase, GT2 family [Aquipseudomonas alcaligenes]|nr:Glycosyltransferase, GT2 family [Pseudomonas alcaligenes]